MTGKHSLPHYPDRIQCQHIILSSGFRMLFPYGKQLVRKDGHYHLPSAEAKHKDIGLPPPLTRLHSLVLNKAQFYKLIPSFFTTFLHNFYRYHIYMWGPGQRTRYCNFLRTGRFAFRIQREKDLLFSRPVQIALRHTQPARESVQGILPGARTTGAWCWPIYHLTSILRMC